MERWFQICFFENELIGIRQGCFEHVSYAQDFYAGETIRIVVGFPGKAALTRLLKGDRQAQFAVRYESSFRKLSISKRSRAVNLPSILTLSPARFVCSSTTSPGFKRPSAY